MNFFKVSAFFALLVASASARPQLGSDLLLADFNAELEDEPFNPNPVYAYTYQVADDAEQTYISHQESRDGEDVQGQYSYVDANGALVTVTYTAGIMGYTEERDVQPNFVTIRARPAKAVVAAAPVVQKVVQQIQPAIQTVVAETAGSSADSDLVAQIIAKLSPFIKETVTSSLGAEASSTGSSSGSTTTTITTSGARRGGSSVGGATRTRTITRPAVSRTVLDATAPAPTITRVVETVQPAQSATAAIFGVGGPNNVQFETPDFNYQFEI